MQSTRLVAAMAAIMMAGSLMAADLTDNDWATDVAKAAEQAKKDGKDLLMIVGPQAGDAAKLKMILSKAEFAGEALKDYVLVAIDTTNANGALAADLGVEDGRLVLVFADSSLKAYGAIPDFHDAPPATYVKIIGKLKDVKARRDKMQADADAASGGERAKLLDAMLNMLTYDGYVFSTGGGYFGYKATIDEICKLDAKNENKLSSQYGLVAASQAAQKAVNEGRFKDAAKIVDEYLANPTYANDVEAMQDATWLRAGVAYFSHDTEGLKSYLKKCVDIAPESPMGQRATEMLAKMQREQDEKNAPAPNRSPTPGPDAPTPAPSGK